MKYKCSKCGFIHEGEMPDGYFCPYCYTNLFDFKLISEEEKKYDRVVISDDNPAIDRINDKCVNCGACKNTCENIVGVHYEDEKKPVCLNCGQCILTCPTGALTPKYDYQPVLELINIPGKTVVALTSPAVRVALGDAFGLKPGEFIEGKMVASLKALGFDYVFDTAFGADLTVMEEAAELGHRLQKKGVLPMFSSCCPSWTKYASIYHPVLLPNISSCKSPIGMAASVIRKIFAKAEGIKNDNLIIVAITPCPAKKAEIIDTDADYVITTSELALLLREQNINFSKLKNAEFDAISASSSGVVFGATGGVTLAALRVFYHNETGKDLTDDVLLIRNKEFYQEVSVKINKNIIKCAVVYQMPNLEKLLPIMNEFIFIEVMNCHSGCVGGGGQVLMPIKDMPDILKARAKSLNKADKNAPLKYPYKNEAVKDLYTNHLTKPLSVKSKNLLHKKS